jgi:hypothetical protein
VVEGWKWATVRYHGHGEREGEGKSIGPFRATGGPPGWCREVTSGGGRRWKEIAGGGVVLRAVDTLTSVAGVLCVLSESGRGCFHDRLRQRQSSQLMFGCGTISVASMIIRSMHLDSVDKMLVFWATTRLHGVTFQKAAISHVPVGYNTDYFLGAHFYNLTCTLNIDRPVNVFGFSDMHGLLQSPPTQV